MSARGLALGVCACVAALLAGCLDFDEQEVYFEHDQQNDRVVCISYYRGLFAEGQDLEQASQQLQEACDKHTVALGGNFPFTLEVNDIREKLRDPEKAKEMDLPSDEFRKKLLSLMERVQVLNGGFFTDVKGRVCGVQVVTIEKVSELVPLGNALISEGLRFAAANGPKERPTSRSEELILRAAEKGHTWARLQGHSLIVTVPLSEQDFKEAREGLVADLLSKQPPGADVLKDVHAALASPVLVWHEGETLSVKCGWEGEPSTFIARSDKGKYEPNLVEHVTRTYGLHFDENALRYMADAGAPAQAEAERAAQIIVPRLPKVERVRILAAALLAQPSDKLWALLRQVPFEPDMTPGADINNAELLQLWDTWLAGQAALDDDEDDDEGDDEDEIEGEGDDE